ncbi:hypothetical protein ALQ92_200069 [Pseudomonas syringae pv. pisi]|uniref:Uncharacterized protein n=1 Tax=Pseudomonas savastanoi pv. phaseolicola TaxID=319 RepID=A0A7Z6Y9U7_PSESH|nr:hypothetical protein ALQ92_200069 [Pseudomonas syringae pv. pisi]RMU87264.1 hypothetical protein ALP21_200126 [Pseudomonas savastanoi pv. phaseolicola]
MKGRRKVRTDKWWLQEQFIKEARAVLAANPNQGHFLQAAAQATCEEPTGILAGRRRVED